MSGACPRAGVANGKKKGLNRKAAAEFVSSLCKYPGDACHIDGIRPVSRVGQN